MKAQPGSELVQQGRARKWPLAPGAAGIAGHTFMAPYPRTFKLRQFPATLFLVSDAAAYVMGHNDRERRRLVPQASLLNPFTQQLFRRAGISSGMNVLDLGCGVGDVSILAARLVGPYGSVTSVDFDNGALETLKARTAAEGIQNIQCVHANVEEWKNTVRSTRSSAGTF